MDGICENEKNASERWCGWWKLTRTRSCLTQVAQSAELHASNMQVTCKSTIRHGHSPRPDLVEHEQIRMAASPTVCICSRAQNGPDECWGALQYCSGKALVSQAAMSASRECKESCNADNVVAPSTKLEDLEIAGSNKYYCSACSIYSRALPDES